MTAFVPVAHIGDLLDNADGVVSSNAITVQTGVFRVCNADDRSMHFSWGGAPNASSDALHVNVRAGSEVFVKLAKPKAAKIASATAANPCVLTLDTPNQQTNIVVGDYVTISGAAVSGYNFSHKEVTAVNPVTGAITIDADASALAAFTGTAFARNSIKISAQGDSSNGLTAHIDEVQLLG